jgi:hypothetical protein
MGIPEIDAGKKHLQLFPGKFPNGTFVFWPGKSVALQSLLPHAKTISLPVQNFETPFVFTQEQIQAPIQWIKIQAVCDYCRQAVDLFPHVGTARPYEYSGRV